VLEPLVLENVDHAAEISCHEAFGPVAVLDAYSDFDEALRTANDSVYGLQAGVFTADLAKAMRAWDALEVGGVVVNDFPTFRVDHMPYGGVKDSGLGREGPRFALEHLTELRLLVVNLTVPGS
jgi:acyl-CoA reductase-like NAD-dependent aldehyde dehydrogenase